MKLPFGLPAPRRGIVVLIGVVLVLAAVWALFDWNWLRRPLERFVAERSGREVRIEDLHVRFGPALAPTVRLRGVYIENAPWASSRKPMAIAGEAQFTFSLKSLWQRRPVVTRLVLKDADVVLERDKRGMRNWRLSHPDKTGPGRIRILTLEPHRSQVRFTHRGIDFDISTAASPLEPGAAQAKNGAALTNRITFTGSYQDAAFSGVALTGEFLSFWDSGESFPVRGHITSGKARLDLDGTLADMLRLSAMDATARIAGPSLSRLYPFVVFRPPATRPFEAEGRVVYARSEYSVTDLRGKVGGTQVTGKATYNRENERPLLNAALDSDAADVADLASLLDLDDAPGGKAAGSAERRRGERGEPGAARPGGMLSGEPLRVDRLKAIDARVTMHARKLTAAAIPALESLRLTVSLNDGLLQLDPDLGVAGGRVAGTVTFDGQRQPPGARVTLNARNVHLERLMPSLAATTRMRVPAQARIKLESRGNSIAAVLGTSTGSAAMIVDGGSISNLADAKLALNRAKVLGLLVRGDADIDLNCAAIAFDFVNGKGTSRILLIDTQESRAEGSATIDLRSGEYDLLLTPGPKQPAIFAQRKSIQVRGAFDYPELLLVERVPMQGTRAVPPAIHELARVPTDNGGKAGACARVLGLR